MYEDKNKIKLGYPLSNRSYIVAVNDAMLEEPNPNVNINTGLDPKTINVLNAAGLFTKANKDMK